MNKVFGLCREQKLTKAGLYREIYSQTRAIRSENFLFHIRENTLKSPRLGMSIRKKHLKNSVDRNAVRRLIRESFRLNRHQIRSVDIVITSKAGIGQAQSEQLRQQLGTVWQRVKA